MIALALLRIVLMEIDLLWMMVNDASVLKIPADFHDND